jgi:hypothetical protein
MADAAHARADLVVKLTCGLIAAFLINEIVFILWPSLAYAAVRTVVIPVVALVDAVASFTVVIRPRQSRRARTIGWSGVVLSLAIWAFQWFWPWALLGTSKAYG